MKNRVRVNTYKVNMVCPVCSLKPNPGCLLEFNGIVLTTFPAKYPHSCTNCGKGFNLDSVYPTYEYEEVQ